MLGNEKGSVIIMGAVAIVAMFAFAVLAIDGAIMMTTKNQLQAAADAAALAGATGLIEGSQATAINRAIRVASYNDAVQDVRRPVVIGPGDVSFPDPATIRVQTHRTSATGDPLRTYFLRVLRPGGNNETDVTAVAAARIYNACSADCVKPWAIPDRWDDLNANGALDPGELYDPDVTGYRVPVDVGQNVVLKVGSPSSSMAPGQFYPVDLPPLDCDCGVDPETGGNQYSWNIANCNPYEVSPGDRLQLEPGNMVGPTRHGMDDLIALDPNAYWDSTNETVAGSAWGMSPRIVLVPMFDPRLPPDSGRNWVSVVKIAAFFIESVGPGSEVRGRFIKVTVDGDPCEGVGPSFIQGIALVE